MMRHILELLLVSLLLTSCGGNYRPITRSFCESPLVRATPYFLVLAVQARHLDYSHGKALLRTMAKHPSDGTKNGDVGHAWILLHGGGRTIEGGHSGELGVCQPKYFEGVMDYLEAGCANPVRYLWEVQKDGFFQRGNGGHRPTFAVKVNLTKREFEAIRNFIDPRHYDYANYAITGNQCASFVVRVAQIAGLELDAEVAVPIPQSISLGRCSYVLWQDFEYAAITISTPDILEKSLMGAVVDGRAEYVLPWYLKNYYPRKSLRQKIDQLGCAIRAFPARLRRVRQFR